ncbi:MAG TPA: hypothetical protein VG056_06150 [Pirellulales bacterium]|nr:hypothetical protein [Pirellulales bacterium]
MERLDPLLRNGDLAGVEQGVAERMRSLPTSPFHVALDLSICNDPADAAQHFDHFFEAESQRFNIAAAYTEMNGFDINPEGWHCDLFAYSHDGGRDDYDWLSDWQSDRYGAYQFRGLERLQAVYAGDSFREVAFSEQCCICSLLVVVRFQRFIESAANLMNKLRFPLYVTAHDYDFIARLERRI